MRKQVVRICMLLACAFGFMQGQASLQPPIVKATIDELTAKDAKPDLYTPSMRTN